MEDATITKETEEQPMYQQGRYPSVVTTDDLVFEMGKQLVGNLNKEKLLDNLLNKSKAMEAAVTEASMAKASIEERVVQLETSNRQYIENNQKLDAELVKIREEVEASEKAGQKTIEETEIKIALLNSEHEKSLAELESLLNNRNEEIQKLKKKTSRKRG